ncbi:MAG: hypothetical protein ABS904_00470 [Solibacillus isronensis]
MTTANVIPKAIPQDEFGMYDLTVFDLREQSVLQWLFDHTDEQLNKLTINNIVKQATQLLKNQNEQPLHESQVLHLCAVIENTFDIEFDLELNLPSLPELKLKGGK